jgi:integrase
MPAQACVIRRDGKRGSVFYVKYVDAAGKQVKERLGPAADGWNRRKAEAELRARLVAVEKDGYRKPTAETFETFARTWVDEYPESKGLKRSTRRGYRQIIDLHLIPAFGRLKLGDVTVERIEQYIAAKRKEGYHDRAGKRKELQSGSINRHLNVLSLIMRAALRRGLVRSNPVPLVDRPKERPRRWRILSPAEVGAVERELDALLIEAETDDEADDRRTVRVLFLTLMGTGIRRGEALGLRWRSVYLADPEGPHLRIEETFIRHARDTPKSAAGHRTIALGSRIAAELFEHRRVTGFNGGDEHVFANPRTGNPFAPAVYAEILRTALKRAGIEGYVRPCHDLRHSSITNAAAAGTPPEALMARAGHSSYSTTRRYVDLAGERFRAEADRLEQRLWGSGTNFRYQIASEAPERDSPKTPEPHDQGATLPSRPRSSVDRAAVS